MKEDQSKSLPLDFSKLSVDDANRALGIIKEILKNAKKDGVCISGNFENITVPLKHLSKALGVRYAVSIQLCKINADIEALEKEINALLNFQKIFYPQQLHVVKTRREEVASGGWMVSA